MVQYSLVADLFLYQDCV